MACDTPYLVKNPRPPAPWEPAYIPVPCGKCAPCLRRRVNSWGFRLQEEDKVSSGSHFVTLTYDTQTVPITDRGYMSLCKRDVQLFFKRLRKLQSAKLKYYAVGEYGGRTNRPHYHIILFNLESDDSIAKAWTNGAVHIGSVSGASIAYTCKYIAKPSRIPQHINDDRIPEFSLISKGLGASYLTDTKVAYHRADISRNYVVHAGGQRSALPKYYRLKIYGEPQLRAQAKLIQQVMNDKQLDNFKVFTDIYGESGDYYAYLQSQIHYRRSKFFNHPHELRDKI